VNVLAFAKSATHAWRWRIVDYNSQVLEESSATFPTIGEAMAAGTERLEEHTERDRRRLVWPRGH
jgi:hypothetical protein